MGTKNWLSLTLQELQNQHHHHHHCHNRPHHCCHRHHHQHHQCYQHHHPTTNLIQLILYSLFLSKVSSSSLVVMECGFQSLHLSAVLSIYASTIQTWEYKLIYQCALFYVLYVSGMKIHPHLHLITSHMVKKSTLVTLVLYAQCFIAWSCYLTSPWLNIPVYCHHP